MPGGYIYKHEGITYMCSNEAVGSMHVKGKFMIGDHYLNAIIINADDFEDGQEFSGTGLIIEDWNPLEASRELLCGKLPKVIAKIVER
jgi:hypothetical protein